jgi:ATP-dependent DNA ligase
MANVARMMDIKRSASQTVKPAPSRRVVSLPPFIPPQLSQLVEKPPSGPQWLHEIRLDGYRMAARIDNVRVQLLTRTGLDWTDKYPSAIAALANLNVKTAYLDGELCGVDEAGLPTFAHTQAATDGQRNVQLVYYAFDLLHLDGWDVSGFSSSSARRFWNRCSQTSRAFSSTAMRPATANSF